VTGGLKSFVDIMIQLDNLIYDSTDTIIKSMSGWSSVLTLLTSAPVPSYLVDSSLVVSVRSYLTAPGGTLIGLDYSIEGEKNPCRDIASELGSCSTRRDSRG